MIVLAGSILVIVSVLIGFTASGGHISALIHPFELVTIGGSALGALIIMSPGKVLKDLAKGLVGAMKGTVYDKQMYREMFKVTYDLLRVARRDGILSLDRHVNAPHESDIFNKYPRIAKNHHVIEFICGGLMPLLDGATKEQVQAFFNAELKVIDEEHHAPISVLSKTADALPGFGIVAAVLGIVITMGAIDGPVEEVGHKVGSALVGTFLGILLSYGFFGPLASRMEFLGTAELTFFRTVATILEGIAESIAPKQAVEQGRRGVGTEARPTMAQMEEIYREAEAA